ncbi:type II secretion system minor pseudopilin GspK [Pectobacterium peruviense]|uniref:Type II secretion system protein K n=1 Tax=Pectobacterium peruviense TaxID=2066479 RepID=A0ABX4S6M2_9GAMM|nr:type II secretion system minor pseudopilin GspK [Pectobacterium peruviense]KML66059.1 type II secretion protein K [Pectobacterium peruviense]PKX83606.1 type II secretion protein K [Pectobacterium peruviense]PKX86144.1 type II secretion protein K [Pectobacterium peruviense]
MRSRQRGVALLVVLLILALMVTIAAVITERTGKAFMRTENHLSRQQAKWYALGAETLSGQILLRDARNMPGRTFAGQNWSQPGHRFPVDGGEIIGQISDARTCFNLNAINQGVDNESTLVKTPYPAQVFRLLLKNLGEDADRAEKITAAVRDWIDADNYPSANGAEDEVYATLPVPYRTANQRMSEISELRAVYGMDSDLYRRLLPYVCALPVDAMSININTLTEFDAPLLSAVFLNEMTMSQAKALVQQRPRMGWASIEVLQQTGALPPNSKNTAQRVLAVKSEWFFVKLQVRVGDSDFHQRSLLHLSGQKVQVVQRQYGGYRTVNP